MNKILFLLFSFFYTFNYTNAQDTINQLKNFTDEIRLENDKFIIMPFNDDSSKIEYFQIVKAPGFSKNELYDLLYKWAVQNYSFKDKPIGDADSLKQQIYVRGSFTIQIGNPRTDDRQLCYVLELSTKDGKYKIEIKDLYLAKTTKAALSIGFFGGASISESKTTENQLENWYFNTTFIGGFDYYRHPRQLVFKRTHEGIIKLRDSIIECIKKEKDW